MHHTHTLPKALTRDELGALRCVPKNVRDQALIETMAGCGLRVSEACALTLDQVHWTTETPYLRFRGKRGRERIVPMNLHVQDALRTWLDKRAGESDYVFCNLRTGGRLSRKTVWDALNRYAERAGIRHVHPHMLRHSFGTSLADREVPLERIKELMGHASVQTSQIYITVSAEQKRRAVERIDARPVLVRWLSRQRNRSYRFWGTPQRGRVFAKGQTVGRAVELKRLQENCSKGIDTLLVGGVGVGKSHLLRLLEGGRVIQLQGLSPAKQAIVSLAEELYNRGALNTASSGEKGTEERARLPPEQGESLEAVQGDASGESFEDFKKAHNRTSVRGWVQIVLDSVEKDEYTLVVDDLSDLTTISARLIDLLAQKFVLLGALHTVKKAHERYFWKFEQIEMGNLPPDEARRLIRQTAAGAEVEDMRMFETHLLARTGGNPRAIIESVERLRREPAVTRSAVRELSHSGAQQQIDMTPVVVIPVLALVAFRVMARGLGNMEFYLVAGLGSALLMGVRFYLFRSSRR